MKIRIVGDLWIGLLIDRYAMVAVGLILQFSRQIGVFVNKVLHGNPGVGALGYVLMT